MNVKIEEAHKTITKYMGADALYAIYIQEATESETKGEYSEYPYLKSLDTLIPVLEKLGCMNISLWNSNDKSVTISGCWAGSTQSAKGETIQEALCLAIAKAILAIQ